MNATTQLLNRLLVRLGTAGVLAIGVGVFTTAFYFMTVAPVRAKLAQVQARAAELHARLPKSAAALSSQQNPAARIDAYYGSFPAIDELSSAVSDTLAAAKTHALAIDQADYHYEPARKDELTAYQMSFTLKGPYPRIRGFLMELLKDNPAMALDGVSFRRDGITSVEIEAKVQLTFYVTSLPWNRQSAAAG